MTTASTPMQEAERPLRKDAARNRELILETAAEVFAEQGLEAGYDEIARRAGIGVGTVYRRFPERSELVQALFETRIDEMVAVGEEAAAIPDAWDGLTWFFEKSVEKQVADRGLKEVMVQTLSESGHMTVGRERIGPIVESLMQRAQADGALRKDVEVTDLGMQLMLIGSLSTPEQPDLWRRYLALLFDALRARPGITPLPLEAPPDEAMHMLMCNLQGRRT
ncbi:TetR/AcrR family transcriptional regulator [Aeromicrobium ginsengisoli]|uniref:TetR/AcrR family transcriptional regulator n=1 Tax=Aeromicrobium ginsengisoli TaxID=363867 RepID=A0A5M4FAM1_9ACTN|nr:TetR/AcrR family transcriptional regulator [Aeromicrobium ginsengisoli]KAA1395436.1 TetR/AcrR family transcriptional regulator [Aeromicrobium ginsengisoli]